MKAIRFFIGFILINITLNAWCQSNNYRVDSISINPKNKMHNGHGDHSLIQNPQLRNLDNQNATYDYIGKTIYNREINRRRIYSINELVK